MKVNELRAQTKTYSAKELQTLIAEMYKAVPKKIKEEKELDPLIRNPQYFKNKRKGPSKQDNVSDIVPFVCENVPEGIRQDDHDVGLRSSLENLAAFTEG